MCGRAHRGVVYLRQKQAEIHPQREGVGIPNEEKCSKEAVKSLI